MTYSYQTKGVCSRTIDFDLAEDGTVHHIVFHGGCSGNTQGVSLLCEGRRAQDLIGLLEGVRCGLKSTSCPDQLAHALELALAKKLPESAGAQTDPGKTK